VAKRLPSKSRRLLKKLLRKPLRLKFRPIRPLLRLTRLLRRLKAPLRPLRNIFTDVAKKLATSRPKGRLVCYWGY
jgi:hypothetical protein